MRRLVSDQLYALTCEEVNK